MRPCGAPIHRVASPPPKIAERFLSFGPDPVVIFRPPPLADERFKLPLRRFVLRRVGGLRRRLRTPQRVGQTELDPPRLFWLKLDGAGLEIKLARLAVGGLGIEAFGLGLKSFVS